MNTMHADYTAAHERLRADMARRDAEAAKRDAEAAKRDAIRDAEAAKRDAEAAKRDKDNLRWQVGLWIAAVVLLGIVIRWPGATSMVTMGSP